MAKVKVLREVIGINPETNEPIRGDEVYPITSTNAVLDPNGGSINDYIDTKVNNISALYEEQRLLTFNTNEELRQSEFDNKENIRDAANQAALDAVETLAEYGEKLSELEEKVDEVKYEKNTKEISDISFENNEGEEFAHVNEGTQWFENLLAGKAKKKVVIEEEGKGLSTNDYTDEDKSKLSILQKEEPLSLDESIDIFDEDNEGILSLSNDGIVYPIERRKYLSKIEMHDFVNATYASQSWTASNKIVSWNNIVCVPFVGAKFYISLTNGIKARFLYGISSSLGESTTWVENKKSIILGNNAVMFNIQFAHIDDSDITKEEVKTLVDSKDITIKFAHTDESVIARNPDCEKYIAGALLQLSYADETEQKKASLNRMPIFAHTSDLHGDVRRFENFMEVCHKLKIDAAISTGDNVCYRASNGSSYMNDICKVYPDVRVLNCLGNHEVSPANTFTDNIEIFNRFIAPFVEDNNYLKSQSQYTDVPYYFADFATKEIRIICLNQYDKGVYRSSGLGGRLGQSQIDWFINTLKNTPKGYGVIILMHASEELIETPENLASWRQTLTPSGDREDEITGILYTSEVKPIKKIVDAFISKSSTSFSYNENDINGNTGELVLVNADFTSVDSSTEFICYLSGHRHRDCIGYLKNTTNKQTALNVTTGNAHYSRGGYDTFAELSDIPRQPHGSIQDAFNIYAIDRKNGEIKIARFGSNMNCEMIARNYIIINYKNI